MNDPPPASAPSPRTSGFIFPLPSYIRSSMNIFDTMSKLGHE